MPKFTLCGKLEFISFFQPIKVESDGNTPHDLFKLFETFFNYMNGKKIKMSCEINSITFNKNYRSEHKLKFENKDDGILCLMERIDSLGFMNVFAYLGDMLQRLNGRQVIIEHDFRKSFSICADPEEKVFGLYYTDGNSCKIPDDKVKEICKPGTDDCCVFLTASANGMECQKFDSYMARNLLQRYGEKTMRANRIGNCEILGRKEE